MGDIDSIYHDMIEELDAGDFAASFESASRVLERMEEGEGVTVFRLADRATPQAFNFFKAVKAILSEDPADFDLKHALRAAEVRAEDAERRLKPFKVNFQKVERLIKAATKAEEKFREHWEDDEARVDLPYAEFIEVRKALEAFRPKEKKS